MTLTMVLWAIGAAVIFGLTNAFAFNSGFRKGTDKGYEAGVSSKIHEMRPGVYRVEYKEDAK
ncbi:hypothetical protein [Planococcus sp. YIM B11945]|uniref:hypothetical protein n=1 Tax=Planococcus sp. YIM B11945 TaxID=3435410 RepID=UPI003D7E6C75